MDNKEYHWIECFIEDFDDKTRELTASEHGGYTEIEGRIFTLTNESAHRDKTFAVPPGILFAYEYDKFGAVIGLSSGAVITTLIDELKLSDISIQKVRGGYYQNNQLIQENGLIVRFSNIPSVYLGAIAQRIKDIFRQESVIVIDKAGKGYFIND